MQRDDRLLEGSVHFIFDFPAKSTNGNNEQQQLVSPNPSEINILTGEYEQHQHRIRLNKYC